MINLDAEDKNVAKLDELVNKFGFEVRIPTGPQLMSVTDVLYLIEYETLNKLPAHSFICDFSNISTRWLSSNQR
jgi:hypothetical protein